jgi:hypothetical protein
MDDAALGRIRARIAGTRIDLRRGEGFPANGRKPQAPSAAPSQQAAPAPAPAEAAAQPSIAPAPTRTVTLLIVGEAREARMRRATNAWAAQTWPEISIGAVGPGPEEGEHRYGPGDEARLRSFLASAHTVVLAGPEEEMHPALARTLALARPLNDVLTWERGPGLRRDGDRLAVLLGSEAPGAFAARGAIVAAYPGALAQELAEGELGGLLHWLAEAPAARWTRLPAPLSSGPAAAARPRVARKGPGRVSLAVWPEWSAASMASLEALASAAAADTELEALTPAGAPIEEVREALARANPSLRRLTVRPVDGPAVPGAGGWLRALGQAASGEVVVFCRAGVELRGEPGALSEICGWALHPLAASATVELTAQEAATPLAGLCLRPGRPGWSAASAFVPSLQGAARPVLAAPAAFMAVSCAKLAGLDGFDGERFPEDAADLDFALRMRRDGLASVLLADIGAAAPAAALTPPALEPVQAMLDPDELAAAADAYPAPIHASAARRRAADAEA